MDAIPLLSPEELAAFLSQPALEGPTPNYKAQLENPPNNNIVAHVAIPICVTLAVLCFLIRVYARIFRLRKVELEDGLMFIGFVRLLRDYLHIISKGSPTFTNRAGICRCSI
jgi:hypothetical protein